LERDSRLGKYVIRQRLAGGGMGVVYRARDAQLGREVALKTILADKAADKDFLLRFKREALSIAQIDHPNIVSLIDFVEGDPNKGEIAFMVMEYLKGKDLGRLIKENGPFEITRAVDRMLEVCAAVGTCHRRGFLHRDLKPTNIFITEYDHIETAKVLDFGVAKMWAENEQAAMGPDREELTRKGMVFGTPEYIAPELLKNKPASPKADQYAIAVVLYAALTGRKPFVADPKADIPDLDLLQAVAKGHHPKPRQLRSEIPQGLEDVVERAMSVNPDDRFKDLHDLGAGLLAWASPAARHRWTAHFTSPPPAPMNPQLSIAIDAHTRDSTIPAPFPPTNSTVADSADRQKTHAIGTEELLQAGESSAAVARRPSGGELGSTSLPISVEETLSPGSGGPSASTLSAPPRPSPGALLRRPIALVVAGGVSLGAAIVIAAVLHRSKPAALPEVAPPPALLNHPAPGAAAPQGPPPAPSAPVGAAPAASAPSLVPGPAPPPPAAIAAPASEIGETPPAVKHPKRKRPKPQVVDQKGFPIPSE
jgi:serine/threonine-protein kinase